VRTLSERLEPAMRELGDRIGLVIDGVDGRVHHVEIGEIDIAKEARIGSIVQAAENPICVRPTGPLRGCRMALASIGRPTIAS
jgi:Protein of unknown function (DUF3363)